MLVKPMIGDWEIPRIESIRAVESRRLARFGVPGLTGDLHQDLGIGSLCVQIVGSLFGDEARDGFLEEVRAQFRAGEPVTFVADILTATELEQVLIEELEVEETNQAADGFRYRIVLRQYVEPPEPPGMLDELGADLAPDLDLLAELGLDGLELPDLLGDIPALASPVEPIQPALSGVEAATAGITELLSGLKSRLGVP